MSCPHGNDPETCSWCVCSGINSVAVGTGPEEYDRKQAEILRVERWHATYNAALGGLLAKEWRAYVDPAVAESFRIELCVEADKLATLTHGPPVLQ